MFYILHIDCSFGQPINNCSSDICNRSVCTNYPNEFCYPDECEDCSLRYFIGNNEVTNDCGKFLQPYNKLLATFNCINIFQNLNDFSNIVLFHLLLH